VVTVPGGLYLRFEQPDETTVNPDEVVAAVSNSEVAPDSGTELADMSAEAAALQELDSVLAMYSDS
jgi:hypothetical protein